MIAKKTPPPTATPIRASSHTPVPTPMSTPARIPGSVIASGMIWCSRSIAAIAMSVASNAAATTKRPVGPNASQAPRKAMPVSNSTAG